MKTNASPDTARPAGSLARTTLLALAAACVAGGAWAQASPYYVGISQALTMESNLGRLADGAQPPANSLLKKRSDTISSTTLIAGFDQPVSRQRFRGNLRLSANRFANSSDLNNQGYAASLGWDWETVNRLSGVAEVSSQQNLRKFDPNETSLVATTAKNLETVNQVNLMARIGGPTRFTGQLGLLWREVNYSSAAYNQAEYDQTTLSAGLYYKASGSLLLGTALRTGTTHYNRAGDNRRRNDLDLTVDYLPSGDLTKAYARVSYTSVSADLAGVNDFRGLSGEARVNWRVTGKTTLTGRLVHDTGQDSAFQSTSTGTTLSSADYSRTTTTLFMGAEHALTAKIQLNAGLTFTHRNLNDSQYSLFAGNQFFDGNDQTTGLTLGARWRPTRAVQLGCDAGHERRTSSGGVRGSTPYSSNTFTCFGQFTLERL
jgi:Putative beta-barrel porin 2